VRQLKWAWVRVTQRGGAQVGAKAVEYGSISDAGWRKQHRQRAGRGDDPMRGGRGLGWW
jgi:hypothetical protein